MLTNLLLIALIIYVIVDVVYIHIYSGDWSHVFFTNTNIPKATKVNPEIPFRAVPDSPLEEIKLEADLVEQIFKGTAQIQLSYDRTDGTFTASLSFTDPIDGNVYNFTSNSSSIQQAINTVVLDYVHLLESQENIYGQIVVK